jgi:uncharacterized RDD family membrane protein YckC
MTVQAEPVQTTSTNPVYGSQPPTAAAIGWSQTGWSNPPYASNQVYLDIEYAGFWKRFAAVLIDGILLWVSGIVALFAAVILEAFSGFPSALWLFAHFVATPWLYFALMESSKWQATIGKRALGILVTDQRGEPVSFGRASGRFWAKWLSNITFYVGYIIAGFTEKKQALHDMVADSLVVVGKTNDSRPFLPADEMAVAFPPRPFAIGAC